ncbi:MAG: deoxynucleoside kinase [Bacteroidetes bacterium]|jgi:deoxyadenosine/deoxycytidine kinase|nr:deoxynucleoside kinase [Bacteroidota bacterium]
MINYICIEGNIGAGKSSIAQRLAADLQGHFLPEEFEENPLLPLFYKDPVQFAFPLEFSFLLDRFRQQKNWEERLVNTTVVSDYYFEKCLYFAELNLNAPDYSVFRDKFLALQSQIVQPQLLVFIKTGVNELKHNIKKRGRVYEQQLEDSYLSKLNERYEQAASEMRPFRVITFCLQTNEQEKYDRLFHELKSYIHQPPAANAIEIFL